MSRRKKVASVAFTGVAALGAVGLTAGHAHAAGVSKVTVTPGGAYTAANVGAPTLGDTTTGNTLTCTSAKANGSLPGSAAGATVGTVAAATFNACSVLGLAFTAKLNKAATLTAIGTTTGGVTQGSLNGISATITGTSGFGCTAVVTGTLPGSYNNATGHLTIDPGKAADLTVKTATSCAGAINAGDAAYFNAVYAVTPGQTVSAT